MKNLLVILILFWFVATSQAQTPTVVHCTVNAEAGRAFAEDIGWYGPLPERDEKPDASKPFQVDVKPSEEIFYAEYIFSQLDTEHPHVKAIFNPEWYRLPSGKIATISDSGKPSRSHEREATVIMRTPFALYFFWEGAQQEIHSAVLDFQSLKAAIGRTFSGTLVTIGVSGATADCQ